MKKIFVLLFVVNLYSCSSTDEAHDPIQPQNLSNIKGQENHKLPDLKNKIGNQYTIETSKDGNDEAIMELNQNLTFYCMKNSRLSHFKNEKTCVEYVQNTLGECEKKYKSANNSLVKCVKKKLNLK